jgi:hypothetical protein
MIRPILPSRYYCQGEGVAGDHQVLVGRDDAIMGRPIARMIDRGNRPLIMAAGIGLLDHRHRCQRPRDRILAPPGPADPSSSIGCFPRRKVSLRRSKPERRR